MKAKDKKIKSKNPINLDNEVIIGINAKSTTKKPNKSKKKQIKKLKNNNKNPINKTRKNNKTSKTKKTELNQVRRNRISKILIIIILIAVSLVLLMMSDLFNCKKIIVQGNQKINEKNIINMSGVKIGENIFKIYKNKVEKNIMQNPYVENVKIIRRLNGTIEIKIEERTATYMINCESGCLYINNQGYILEKADEPIQVPAIIGVKTDLSLKKVGERLENDDLIILEKIIKIIDVAKVKELANKITYFNVENDKNIQIYIDSEKKLINLGDEKDLAKKFNYINIILEKEKGHEGEIFLRDKPYFREKV